MMNGTNNPLDISGVTKSFAVGEIIAREGEPSEGWYVLMSGKVGVFKGDLNIVEFDQPGTIFGELGCILDVPRTATLQALEPTSVLYVESDIDDLIANHPTVAKSILVSLAERLSRTTHAWWALVGRSD